MPKDAMIRAFRFLRSDDLFDPQWQDWSRAYEWAYVLEEVRTLRPATLHNTGCGFEHFQKPFAEALNTLVPVVLHTDVQETETFHGLPNFRRHDAREPMDQTFACVLAISYLEEIPPRWHRLVLNNLWAQVAPGGRLLVTCDVERALGCCVSVSLLEAWVGAVCERKAPLLTGMTSKLGARQDRPLKVVLMDLEKRH